MARCAVRGEAPFLATSVHFTVKKRRVHGISEHLHVTGVDLRGVWSRDVRMGEFREDGPEDGPVYPDFPQVASSYREFCEIVGRRGGKAEAASART